MLLKNCTAICIDTINHSLAAKATNICGSLCDFADVFLLSDRKTEVNTKIVPTLDGSFGYNKFVLEELINFVETEFVLIFQWDGFIIDPGAWRDEFFAFDYIGAPWPTDLNNGGVGNGGFSIRSRLLLEKIALSEKQYVKNEDVFICEDLMPIFETSGMKVAPIDVASRFSFERLRPTERTFGFHGDFNFAKALDEQTLFEIISLSPETFWQTWRPFTWISDAIRNDDHRLASRLHAHCLELRPTETALWHEQCGKALLGQDATAERDRREDGVARSRSRKTAIVVAGMHRSGTSSLAGALIDLGATAPKTPMPENTHDPLGYWESMEVMRFNDDLLASRGSRWNDVRQVDGLWGVQSDADPWLERARRLIHAEYGDSSLFVIKDPRISRIFSVWERALAASDSNVAVVVLIRSPYEVAGSLESRDGIDFADGLRLWLHYNLEVEFATRTSLRIFVEWDELLSKPRPVLAGMADRFGLRWPNNRNLCDWERHFGLLPHGRRQKDREIESGSRPELRAIVDQTHATLHRLTINPDCDDARWQLDVLRNSFRAIVEAETSIDRGDLHRELEEVKLHYDEARAEVALVREEINAERVKVSALFGELSEQRTRSERIASLLRALTGELQEFGRPALAAEAISTDIEHVSVVSTHLRGFDNLEGPYLDKGIDRSFRWMIEGAGAIVFDCSTKGSYLLILDVGTSMDQTLEIALDGKSLGSLQLPSVPYTTRYRISAIVAKTSGVSQLTMVASSHQLALDRSLYLMLYDVTLSLLNTGAGNRSSALRVELTGSSDN